MHCLGQSMWQEAVLHRVPEGIWMHRSLGLAIRSYAGGLFWLLDSGSEGHRASILWNMLHSHDFSEMNPIQLIPIKPSLIPAWRSHPEWAFCSQRPFHLLQLLTPSTSKWEGLPTGGKAPHPTFQKALSTCDPWAAGAGEPPRVPGVLTCLLQTRSAWLTLPWE